MRKRALTFLITVILGFVSIAGPVCSAAASDGSQTEEESGSGEDSDSKGLLEQGMEVGGDLYDKVDEKLDNVDKVSLRREIREALEQMDEMGISPAMIAQNLFGIRPAGGSGGKKPEIR